MSISRLTYTSSARPMDMYNRDSEMAMDTDQALDAAHAFGRTQILVTIAACLTQVQVAWIALSTVFLAEVVERDCSRDLNNTDDDMCCEFHNNASGEAGGCTTRCEYDTELTGVSIVSEWDLICTKDYLPDLSQSILMAGYAVGSIVAGPLADKYGRRPVQLVSLIIVTLVGLSVYLSPNYFMYVSLRFTCGALIMIVKIPSATLLLEYLIPRYRGIVGSIPFCASSIALMVLPGLAYYVRDWRFFHLVIMLPSVIYLSFCWFIPESVRWIISNGDMAKAEETIQNIARCHNVTDFPFHVFQGKTNEASSSESLSNQKEETTEQTTPSERKEDASIQILLNLFRMPTVKVTVILSWNWATYLMIYFGFALTTGTLAGNIYLNFFLISLVDFPARFLSLFIIKKLGTVPMVSLGYTSSALALVGIIVLSFANEDGSINKWVITSLALLGKFFISISLAAVNLMMSDLFPTTVRNSGRGFVQLIGNIGNLCLPLLLYLNKFVPNLAFMTISSCAFIGAGLCLLLPETVKTTQPDTPTDLQNLFDTKRLLRRKRERHTRKHQLSEDAERSHLDRLGV